MTSDTEYFLSMSDGQGSWTNGDDGTYIFRSLQSIPEQDLSDVVDTGNGGGD